MDISPIKTNHDLSSLSSLRAVTREIYVKMIFCFFNIIYRVRRDKCQLSSISVVPHFLFNRRSVTPVSLLIETTATTTADIK